MSVSFDDRIQYIECKFKDWGDIVKRKFYVGENKGRAVYITYIDDMVDRNLIEEEIIKNLIINIRLAPPDNTAGNVFDFYIDGGVTTADIKNAKDIDEAILEVMSGNTLMLIDGCDEILVISTKGFPKRGVDKPETEIAVQGPQEAFAESIRINTVLIRRRIRDTRLKCVQSKAGNVSQTDVALMYMEGVADNKLVENIKKKLADIKTDMVYDSGYLEQLLEGNKLSPFPQIQLTERPDKVAAELMEGRIALVVDTSPFVILLPAVLASFYQASEDYYQRWEIMSFIRIIRYLAGFVAFSLPGLYIAVSLYHPSMIPTQLALRLAGARQTVPISTVVEIIIMELIFEALREAGTRIPASIGSTLGIVGGIIIGQAAVDAGLVSPMAVIIIALTGICSFAIPNIALVSAYRLIKYFIILTSAFAGLLGYIAGLLLVLIHIASLDSFGIPYLAPLTATDRSRKRILRDTIFRFPLKNKKNGHFYSEMESENIER